MPSSTDCCAARRNEFRNLSSVRDGWLHDRTTFADRGPILLPSFLGLRRIIWSSVQPMYHTAECFQLVVRILR